LTNDAPGSISTRPFGLVEAVKQADLAVLKDLPLKRIW